MTRRATRAAFVALGCLTAIPLGAQDTAGVRGRETSWSVGGQMALRDLVTGSGPTGRLRPAAMAEIAVHDVSAQRRRLGAFVQATPFPAMRVTGLDLQDQPRTITIGSHPLLIVRLLTEFAPLAAGGRVVPSFGVGYTAYVQRATGCAQGTDSPLCHAAARVHGAHGPSAHLSLMGSASRDSRLAVRLRYLVTSAPDAVQHDLTLGMVLRPAAR